MDNQRKAVLIGGVGLVKGRVRNAGAVMVEICDELEPILRDGYYCQRAPFQTVSLIIRFGSRQNLDPEYQPIDNIHSELPMSVELEMEVLKTMDRDQLKRLFLVATLKALIHAGHEFDLPTERLESVLKELSSC